MQSTRLDQLPPPDEMGDPQTRNTVLDILDEVRQENDRYNNNVGGRNMQQQQDMQQQQQQQYPQQQYYNNNKDDIEAPPHIPKNNDKEDDEDIQEDSFIDGIYSEIKHPLLFIGLFTFLNLPFMVYVLSKYIPWMINYRTGSATFTGLLVRALIGAVLFYILTTYIM